ncbi:MBL fold metallo-hydrolase [Halobaculum halobium]|uniref:MBL fold metallo-hydrolase n=1 Tax=Halobaculum halobium TaxID=3032281 RepID=A0ABD5T897_9EURY|nr:MBL fold metallo-hydrolase [Halobaculum sp. SYNS20]
MSTDSPANSPGTVQLVRHATLLITLDETTLLVDPMLGEAGADPPVENTPNQRRNPTVDLPPVDLDHDAVLVTHRHNDHFDDAARDRLDTDVPLIGHPEQIEAFESEGFTDARPLDGEVAVGDLRVAPTPARHGHGDLATAMAPVTGALVRGSARDRSVYLTGDTVWYDGVAETLATAQPNAVVVNAGGARFREGKPITMDADDVRRVREATPDDSTVAAAHMDAINHCLVTRDDLRDAVDGVAIPADGEVIPVE